LTWLILLPARLNYARCSVFKDPCGIFQSTQKYKSMPQKPNVKGNFFLRKIRLFRKRSRVETNSSL
jgi:hypothetical protein